MTIEFLAPRDWLLDCDIKTAGMESTSNYWITLYDVLTQAGIDVYLVKARHVNGVPGKKTDVCDAQWLQQLHDIGLLRKSFCPALKAVWRARSGSARSACNDPNPNGRIPAPNEGQARQGGRNHHRRASPTA